MDHFPPLDTHAHVEVTISQRDLLALKAVVLVATRSLSEHASTMTRSDPLAIWGVGIHPGVPAAVADFEVQSLRRQLRGSPLLSEVGLDRRSPVPLQEQRRVLAAALEAHDDNQCIASVHSSGRTAEVLDVLQGHRCSTIILHWWRGSADETRAAIELGCYFSFSHRDTAKGSVFGLVPVDRVLTETDHPYGDRGNPDSRPGATTPIEERIHPKHPEEARRQIWMNFRSLVETAGVLTRLPTKVAGLVAAAPTSSHVDSKEWGVR